MMDFEDKISSIASMRSLQMLEQDKDGNNQFVCQSLDVIDACRGTSVSYRYRGKFFPYEGPCDGGGKILEGYPIYRTNPSGNEIPKYMYALGVYPSTWSVKELRGLVRWRIVDFDDFNDQTSCRTESANVNQVDFASDGQPYNYWPTIFCFDEDGNELDGYKSSTINIRCNDRNSNSGYITNIDENSDNNQNNESDNRDGQNGKANHNQNSSNNNNNNENSSNTTLVLGILLILAAVGFSGYVIYTRYMKPGKKRKKHRSGGSGKKSTKGGRTTIDSVDDSHPDKLLGNNVIIPKSNIDTEFDLDFEEPPPKRPFSDHSVMADSLQEWDGDHAPSRPASMHTVSKPYELVEVKMPKAAPEPPKSPDSSSSNRGFLPKKFSAAAADATMKENPNLKTAILDYDKGQKQQQQKEPRKPPERKQQQQQQQQQQSKKSPEPKKKSFPDPIQPETKKKQPSKKPSSKQIEEVPKERGRDPSIANSSSGKSSFASEKDFGEEGTFLSESLSNLFQTIDKSLDDALAGDEEKKISEDDPHDSTGPTTKTSQYERIDPPEFKAPQQNTNVAKLGKHDDMDLSQRSKFMEARGRWSLRGKGFGKDEYQASKYSDAGADTKNQRKFVDSLVDDLWLGDTNSISKTALEPRRSRSLDNNRASEFANARRKFERSRSKERSDADKYKRSRSRSKERSGANDYANQKGRSKSKERSGADDYANQRGRFKSKERSRANDYANQGGRSMSKERSGANDYVSHRGRSKSKERSKADAYAGSRSRSKERSDANAYAAAAQMDTGRRGRSKERSGASDYASGNKHRPKSLERSGANGYAQTKKPSRSLERTPASDYGSSSNYNNTLKQQPATSGSSKGRSRSYDASKANTYVSDRGKPTSSGAENTPKTRSRSYDTSNANNFYANKRNSPQTGTAAAPTSTRKAPATSSRRTSTPFKPTTVITKNTDGSILVAKRRKREDGATVTTKTKYANITLARKHGVNV